MKDLKVDELKDFISKGDTVVDFWASWCGPCKMLGPVFEEVSKELEKVKFAKADIDEVGEAAVELGVRGVPTIILFRDGKELNRIVGFVPKDVLKSQISESFS
ncbi:thioredoxin [Candidatus Woesearchaeota archaeon]|nr:thioredoxin [Candidatus Woesearchaeota archaeon]